MTIEKLSYQENKDQLRLLLLQIRVGQDVRAEEHESFANHCRIKQSQIEILNVFDTPDFSDHIADGYDALLIGGASEANVLQPETYPFVKPAQALIQRCAQINLPVFASCFGFQLAVLALGGSIRHKEKNFEMGTVPIQLTKIANKDPLFADTPNGFYGVSVHKQYASELPKSTELLAYTEQCIHSFRLKDKPFWAFQFHPEVDKATLVQRLTLYKDHYAESDSGLDSALKSAQETPASNQLMGKFIDNVVLKQKR